VLEPSAGTGRILDALTHVSEVVAVEIHVKLQAHLYRCYPTVHLKAGDFLTKTAAEIGLFDRVIMNPPFERGEDVRHILHARALLHPGGKLTALCYDGVAQHRHLMPIAESWTPLHDGSFRCEGTNAGVILLTIMGPL
jgi:hypothetical protein